jgi:hypothetical protein
MGARVRPQAESIGTTDGSNAVSKAATRSSQNVAGAREYLSCSHHDLFGALLYPELARADTP